MISRAEHCYYGLLVCKTTSSLSPPLPHPSYHSKMAGALRAVAARAPLKSLHTPLRAPAASWLRTYATVNAIPPKPHHRVVIVGGGTAGTTVAAQLLRTKEFQKDEIAILDPAKEHHYQPGWTLVGSGLKPLSDMSRPLSSVVPDNVAHYPLQVSTFDPANNELKTSDGVDVSYEYLIVAPGLETNFAGIKGLPEALQDTGSNVSSIYSNKTVEQVWKNIQGFKKGSAIFTQPAGIIKCAGAPQKIMWMALSQWEKDGVRKEILPYFATGAPGRSYPSNMCLYWSTDECVLQPCSPSQSTRLLWRLCASSARSRDYSNTT